MTTTDCADCKRGLHSHCDGGAWIHGEATECACFMENHYGELDQDEEPDT